MAGILHRVPLLPFLATLALAAAVSLTGCSEDCDNPVCPPPPPTPEFSHADHFAENPYAGPNMNVACVGCHANEVNDLMATGHWNWEGVAANDANYPTETHGKTDIINNFCIAIPSNEGRCTQCHIGVGWADKNFNHADPGNVDCLVCHDGTGTYAKNPTAAGAPVADLDWAAIGSNLSMPNRSSCGKCHYSAGGGDNVKHGDLAANLNETTREADVHMGTDGGNFSCQACHGFDENHGVGGMYLHSVDEGNMKRCADCHTSDPHAAGGTAAGLVSSHPTLSCQVCHIPAIARVRTTKTEWYWATAGDSNRTPIDVGDGRFDYDKKKGNFVWANNVRPTLRRHDGKWNKMYIGVNDTYTGTPSAADPVVLAEPSVPKDPAQAGGAMIYPFKKMVGNQPADTGNMQFIVPHLFGSKGGPNPYWARFDWDLALQDGAAYTEQTYSGSHGFIDTVMYLTVNHEVAPKEMALGTTGCTDCHGAAAGFDWSELGRTDPLGGS